jgi:parallel beta-helix repeat protein
LPWILISPFFPSYYQSSYAEAPLCFDLIPSNITIRLTCGSATLTDLYNAINKHKTAMVFEGLVKESDNGIWLLKSNLVVGNNSSLTINSNDTSWLKIYSDGKQVYTIKAYGDMTIDGVKITSWNPEENDYQREILGELPPRPFIVVKEGGMGTTNVTNSELAYLGYGAIQGHGLSYYSGNGSVVRGNNIHHLEMGFYSDGIENILIEDNHVHHNKAYGLDPHSGTRNIVIHNNVVNDNGHIGIICSGKCRNIIIQQNEVYNNSGTAIVLSIDMQNSTIKNNYIHDSETGLVVAKSHNNHLYGNRISSSDYGIKIIDHSSNNYVQDNTFEGIEEYAILVRGTSVLNNTLENNSIDNSSMAVRIHNNNDSVFINNKSSAGREYFIHANSTLNFERTFFPIKLKVISDESTDNMIRIVGSGKIKVKDGTGNVTDFDTDALPFSSRVYDEALSIISSDSTFANLR